MISVSVPVLHAPAWSYTGLEIAFFVAQAPVIEQPGTARLEDDTQQCTGTA